MSDLSRSRLSVRVVAFALLAGGLFGLPLSTARAATAPVPSLVSGALRPLDTTTGWTPSDAPMPASLPSGAQPQSMVLYSTSCSSSSFCLSVGNVTDTLLNNFPVVETYSGGNWSVALAPMPANSASPTSGSAEAWDGTLTSVSCPSDGECAAVGDYNAYDPTTGFTNQSALLESLTAGVWSTVEGALPSVSLTATIVNLDGVSCPTTTSCDAVGALTGVDAENDSKWIGLLYLWSDSGWQLGSLPIPPEYDNSLEVNSVACADVDDCVAVGFYEDAKSNSYGLILTMSGGVWIATDAPLPENAIADPDVIPSVALYGVDCPQVGDCVAGGLYTDSSVNTDPLLEVLQSGTWTPLEGPEPADAPSGSVGLVTAVSCPAAGACIASGRYGGVNGYSGMILTQSGNTWSAADAPLAPSPVDPSDIRTAQTSSATTSSLAAMGCDDVGLCAAGGVETAVDGTRDGLLEIAHIKDLPEIAEISPAWGVGGTVVTIRGANFAAGASVDFGGLAAARITYVDADEIQAVAPGDVATSNVSVTVGGVTTRASSADVFNLGLPTLHASGASGAVTGRVTYSATMTGGGPTPTGTVTVNDGRGATCSIALEGGKGACAIEERAEDSPYSVTEEYGGDGTYPAVSAAFVEEVERARPAVRLSSAPTPAETGRETYLVALSARGADDYPTGIVVVRDGAGGACRIRLKSGVGACAIVERAADSPYSVTEIYPGDGNFLAVRGTFTKKVIRAKPTIEAASSASPTTAGRVTYRVTVSGNTGAVTPTGSVTVHDSAGASCTLNLNRSGRGGCSIRRKSATHSVSVSYQGDSNYIPAFIVIRNLK